MASRNILDWLYVSQTEHDWFVTCGPGMDRLVASIQECENKFPSVILMVGQDERSRAQHAMFPFLDLRRGQGVAHLQEDPSTVRQRYPLIVATIDLHTV